LPSLLPAILIAITIALSTLALFIATIIIHFMLSSFVVAHRSGCRLPCQQSLTSHHLPLPILLLIDCCLLSLFAIALVAIACLPPLSPLLLLPLPLPSLLHTTLVADTMAHAALALFVNRHPHCHHHCPCHSPPLCCCHHHPPHALAVCCRPPSWLCGCLVNTLLPATTRLCYSCHWLIVMVI
jgi:hypothetical protein